MCSSPVALWHQFAALPQAWALLGPPAPWLGVCSGHVLQQSWSISSFTAGAGESVADTAGGAGVQDARKKSCFESAWPKRALRADLLFSRFVIAVCPLAEL